MDFIFIGQNVKFMRTDGRFQKAVVAKIDGLNKSVEVQWFECGESRGKHIELAHLLNWNPELVNKNLTYYIPQDQMRIKNNIHSQNGRKSYRQTISGYDAQNLIPTVECTGNEANAPRFLNNAIIVPSTASIQNNREIAEMIREFKNTIEFKPLFNGQTYVDDDNQPITVCVRKMPFSLSEIIRNDIDVISVPQYDTLIVHEPKIKYDLTTYLGNHKFRFDYVFDHHCDNAMVYEYTAKPLIKTVFDGGMATCFAYGATGTGKTQTMEGDEFICTNHNYNKVMAAKDILNCLKNPQYKALNLVMSVSSFEIHEEEVFDLLAKKEKVRVLEDDRQQVQIVRLREIIIDSVKKAIQQIQQSCKARMSGVRNNVTRKSAQFSTNLNSSYSRAVFQIILRSRNSCRVHGKFSFIDLAGNTPSMEDAKIDKSLLRLRECIRSQGNKLSQVLRETFTGVESEICVIAMISSGLSSFVDTLKILRYVNYVKQLPLKNNSEVLKKENPIKVQHIIMKRSKNEEAAENINEPVVPNEDNPELKQKKEVAVGQYRDIMLRSHTRVKNLPNYVESEYEYREMMADFCEMSSKEERFSSTIKPLGKY